MVDHRVRHLGRRQFLLVLQPSLNTTTWILKRRHWRGSERNDEVLAHGALNYTVQPREPRDVIRDLRRIADDLEGRFHPPAAPAAPEPPGGGYGGQLPLPGMVGRTSAFLVGGQPLVSGP